MKRLMAGVALLVAGFAAAPRSTRAGDVERMQRACEEIERGLKVYGGKPPHSSALANELDLDARAGRARFAHSATRTMIDLRIRELFCR